MAVKKADVIVVLGCWVEADGSLNPESRLRVEKAVELFRKGVSQNLLMSGAWSFMRNDIPPKTEAEAMRDYAVSLGVERKHIFIEKDSKDTIGNAYFTKLILRKKGWKKIIAVTSDFHVGRAKYVFSKVLGKEYRIRFAGSKIDSLEHEAGLLAKEEKILEFMKEWLDRIVIGDDKRLKAFLFSEHPGYAKNPKISKEKLLSRVFAQRK